VTSGSPSPLTWRDAALGAALAAAVAILTPLGSISPAPKGARVAGGRRDGGPSDQPAVLGSVLNLRVAPSGRSSASEPGALVLKGVVQSPDGSLALVGPTNGDASWVAAGQQVAGVVVVEIRPGSVNLRLPGGGAATLGIFQPAPSAPEAQPRRGAQRSEPASGQSLQKTG
jgi:hypothetical protein